MEAAYWNRQTLLPYANVAAPKRQRTEFDAAAPAFPPPVHEDTRTLGATYNNYLQNAHQPFSSYVTAQAGKSYASSWPPNTAFHNGASTAYPGPESASLPLPPDASSTLYVEGLPRDATEREVARILEKLLLVLFFLFFPCLFPSRPAKKKDIFRPLLGFQEVRLVKKEPKYESGSPVLLCFVDFTTPAYAMAALNAVEGYSMDIRDPDSSILRLQFARFPARRTGRGGHRGWRERD